MEDIRIRFGRRLKKLRQERGWSQETLANLADIDRTYLPGIESGKRNVSIILAERLARVFGMSISELFKEV